MVATLACGFVAACASTPSSDRVHALSDVDTAPGLLGCPAYREPARVPNLGASGVTLVFVLDEAGAVVPSSIQPREPRDRRSGEPLSPDLIERARSALLSCSFSAARLEGRAVKVRMEKRFRYVIR